ncbi:MAG: hypothetical protein LBP89_08540 [Helicobacteraceae bacterium]|jgi:hypothetical protein|nr:hypothetical protein [Helicobacteraceae bacterium]
MKKLWLFAFISSALFAAPPSQPRLFSPIGPAISEAIDISPAPCNAACLERLLKEDKIFSFLARYKKSPETERFDADYQRWATFLNLAMPRIDGERIAVLASNKVGRYAVVVVNSVGAYLLSKGKPFEIRVFDSFDESQDNLERAIQEIESAGYVRALAVLTADGVKNAANLEPNIELYIPTVNRNELYSAPNNFFFGGIDYAKQLEALSHYANRFRIAIFDQPFALNQRITAAADAILPLPPSHITLTNPRVNYAQLFKTEKIGGGMSILLNTVPDRTSMVLSQLTFNDVRIASALSTQINYKPLLLTLPQSDDVKNLYIASAIGRTDMTLRDLNLLLRNDDLRFEWTAYAASALTDMISQRNKGDYSPRVGLFGLEMSNNQVQYPIKIYQIKNSRFVLAPPPPERPLNETLPPVPSEANGTVAGGSRRSY